MQRTIKNDKSEKGLLNILHFILTERQLSVKMLEASYFKGMW